MTKCSATGEGKCKKLQKQFRTDEVNFKRRLGLQLL